MFRVLDESFFFPPFSKKKKRFTEDQIGTYFTHKKKEKTLLKEEERRINHVLEIGRTSHRDRFGDHVLVRRRVVSNARSSFFFCLQSFFLNIRFCCLRGSRPPTLRLRLHKSCLGRRFFTIVLCWNKDARKKTQQRRPCRRSKTELDDDLAGSSSSRVSASFRSVVYVVYVERQSRRHPRDYKKPAEDGRKRSF